MKERPILFSGPMVRAILSGAKTQTRRPVRLPGGDVDGAGHGPAGDVLVWSYDDEPTGSRVMPCPMGKVGDRLWVRETWREERDFEEVTYPSGGLDVLPVRRAYHRAGLPDAEAFAYTWKPSIHMPRWASRITLEVTDVRVQRLQAITDDDARAEGFGVAFGPGMFSRSFPGAWDEAYEKTESRWSANPWVWAVTFERIEGKP